MMKVTQMLTVAALATVLALSATSVSAQDNGGNNGGGRRGGQGGPGGFGNFDPAQMRERMMERTKESLEITDDTEWKAIEPLVQKVMDARMASFSGMGRGMMGGRRGGPGGPGGDNADSNNRRGGMFGQPNPEADALQKAIDAKASGSELKTALAKYNASRKAKQADLEKAQADLRKVLSVRQEALATLNGLL
jgi:hypothetical protein